MMVRQASVGSLTLRPLARCAGVSVATVNHHFSTRDGVIAHLVAHAISRERRFYRRWAAVLATMKVTDVRSRAQLADVVFSDWIETNRVPLMLLLDVLQSRARGAFDLVDIESWQADAGEFWSVLCFGTAAHAKPALGYVLDEGAYSLGAGSVPLYRALRSACLARFIGRFAPSAAPGSNDFFSSIVALLEPGEAVPAVSSDQRVARIAHEAAAILRSQGVEAVTHRAVATGAGVPASTVVYHFGPREALISAGLYAIIEQFHRGLGTDDPQENADRLVKATGLIALASARMPGLVPHAIDMRRRRGENIARAALANFGVDVADGDDRLTAQAMAIAFFGMRTLDLAMHKAGDDRRAQLQSIWAGAPRRAGQSP